MNLAHLIAMLLACLLCGGCNVEREQHATALEITPLPPMRNESIEIRYDRTHPEAKYPDREELFATINVTHPFGVRTYRLRMQEEGDMVTTLYRIPADACYISIYLAPYGQMVNTETFVTAVDAGEHPAEYALPAMINQVRSYSEACDMFEWDQHLYPETPERYITFWENKIKTGIDTAGILREVDSLRNAALNRDMKRRHRLSALVACAMAYYLLSEYEMAHSMLTETEGLCDSSNALTMLSVSALCSIIHDDMEQTKSMPGAEKDGMLDSIRLGLLDISIGSGNPELMKQMIRYVYFSPGSLLGRTIRTAKSVRDAYYDILMGTDNEELVTAMELLEGLSQIFYEVGEYERVYNLYARHEHTIAASTKWIQENPELPVNIFPASAAVAEMEFLLGKSHIALHEERKGIEVLGGILQKGADETLIWPMMNSAEYLANHYLERGEYDSTMKYLSCAIVLDSRNSEQLHADVRSAFASTVTDRAFASTLQSYFNPDLVRRKPAPKVAINTDEGDILLSDTRGKGVVILYHSSTCSICKTILPAVLRECDEEVASKFDVVVYTDVPRDELQQGILKGMDNYTYARIDDRVFGKLKVPGFPFMSIIRDGHLEYHGTMSATSGAYRLKMYLAK